MAAAFFAARRAAGADAPALAAPLADGETPRTSAANSNQAFASAPFKSSVQISVPFAPPPSANGRTLVLGVPLLLEFPFSGVVRQIQHPGVLPVDRATVCSRDREVGVHRAAVGARQGRFVLPLTGRKLVKQRSDDDLVLRGHRHAVGSHVHQLAVEAPRLASDRQCDRVGCREQVRQAPRGFRAPGLREFPQLAQGALMQNHDSVLLPSQSRVHELARDVRASGQHEERDPKLRALGLVNGDRPGELEKGVVRVRGPVRVLEARLRRELDVEMELVLRTLRRGCDEADGYADLTIGDVVQCPILRPRSEPPVRRLHDLVAADDELRADRLRDVALWACCAAPIVCR